jgi:hypothetical protein
MSIGDRITAWVLAQWARLTGLPIPIPPKEGAQQKEKQS